MAIEIVDVPIDMMIFHSYVNVYKRVWPEKMPAVLNEPDTSWNVSSHLSPVITKKWPFTVINGIRIPLTRVLPHFLLIRAIIVGTLLTDWKREFMEFHTINSWGTKNGKNIPLEIHPKGSAPPFCSYKTQGLEKNLQNDWVPMNFSPYKMVGPCASTTSFHHPSILYGGILSRDVRFLCFPEYEFCLHAWTLCPKKGTICKNLFLYHFPSFFSIVIKEQPILFVRKWAQWYVRPAFLQCWRKVKRSYPCFFCLGGELCWKSRLTGTSGMAVNFEILVVATLQHACTKVQACKQNSYSEKEKIEHPGWVYLPWCKELVDAQGPAILYWFFF